MSSSSSEQRRDVSAAVPPSRTGAARPSLHDRVPLFAMLAADGLAVVGRGFAVGLLAAMLFGDAGDALLAGVPAATVAAAAIARREQVLGALTRLGLWRSSVVADGLAAVGLFAVLLHQNARADHPLVLVGGVLAAAVGIGAQSLLGPRMSERLARRAQISPERLVRRWPRARVRLSVLAVVGAVVAVVVVGPPAGWVAFGCFAQAAEAVVVLVPFTREANVRRAR